MKVKAKGVFSTIGAIVGVASLFGSKPKAPEIQPLPQTEKAPEAPKVTKVSELDSSSTAASLDAKRNAQRARRTQQSRNLFDLSAPKTAKKTLLGE